MLNKLDDGLAPNLCLFTLLGVCIFQLILLLGFFGLYFTYFLCFSILINIIFIFRVFMISAERSRVYYIIKNRIEKKGYSKFIFEAKCVSICQLTQAFYIALRYNSPADFSYFWRQHIKKVPKYVMEDEDLENILNNINYSKTKEGQVIYEFKK